MYIYMYFIMLLLATSWCCTERGYYRREDDAVINASVDESINGSIHDTNFVCVSLLQFYRILLACFGFNTKF